MPSEVVEGRAAKPHQMGATLPPAVDNDPLPCPRCESTNTKFCYYNNYNFSQPRHFCKSCRRYWTHGGTLRDIPVGGGSRKTAKRSRTSSTPVVPGSGSSSASGSGSLLDPLSASPVFVSLPCSVPTGPSPVISGGGNASFTSLLGGFGLGLDDVGFGLGRGVWAFPEVGYGNDGGINAGGVSVASGSGDESVNRGDTWQADSGDNGFGSNGDCFPSLPELAISTPGNTLK